MGIQWPVDKVQRVRDIPDVSENWEGENGITRGEKNKDSSGYSEERSGKMCGMRKLWLNTVP